MADHNPLSGISWEVEELGQKNTGQDNSACTGELIGPWHFRRSIWLWFLHGKRNLFGQRNTALFFRHEKRMKVLRSHVAMQNVSLKSGLHSENGRHSLTRNTEIRASRDVSTYAYQCSKLQMKQFQ